MLVRTRKPDAGRKHAVAAKSARAQPASVIARVLQLQRAAGNQAVARALAAAGGHPKIQRWDWETFVDVAQWTNPLTIGQKAFRELTGWEVNLWSAAEAAVRASASKTSIPADYVDKLKRYAAYNAEDGAILKNALAQNPSHYMGGLLLGGNKDAAAITFGNSIFYGTLDVDTFIHEMVHINQYHVLGREAFLVSYFGLSLATIIKRAIQGKALDVMRSSPHEEQAYQLEQRFKSWRQSNP